MKTIIPLAVLQMLTGLWLFISPFLFEYKELTGMAFNDMFFGAIVFILGLGVFLRETFGIQAFWGIEHCLHPSCNLRRL